MSPTPARASGPGYFGNANCLSCHAVQQSFDVPPVDRDTACVACHAPGLVGTHPYHQAGSNCAAYCHPGWGNSLLTAVPNYTDPTSGASFASAMSKDTPSSVLHIIHSNPRWAENVDRPDSRCASCHAAASCDACHTGAIGAGHTAHSSTSQTPYSGRFGHGIIGTDQSIWSVQTEATMCATSGCHDIETTRSNAAHTRENFSHAANPAYGFDGPNTVTLTPSATDWRTRYNSKHTAGRMSLSNYTGAGLSITFEGERILLVGDKDPYRGIGEVWIDGVLAGTVDFYAPTTTYQATVFDSGPLSPGSHTITVRATGTKNESSRHTFVSVDCFKVYAALPASVAPGCTESCHPAPHNVPALHTASPPDDWVLVFLEGEHDSEMRWDGYVYASCGTCHARELGAAHNMECLTCHLSPADTLGTWTGGCQQGGCHTTYHADASRAHWSVENDCNKCHGSSWAVTASACPNCHAVFSASDTVPPVTTSNAKASYVGAADIEFSVTEGGKVGIATTYYRLNGGTLHVGSKALINVAGTYTMEFWSVDQAGNVESPPRTASFTIAEDTTPPITTSNAGAAYYNPVTIRLTATDNSSTGVKATYYTLNGGPVQTGTSIYIPKPASGTVSYTLQFWSEDYSGNVETPKTASFTMTGGEGTIRLVWGDSDITGNPPPAGSYAYWYIRRGTSGGALVASGSGAMPGWDGVDDVVVPVSNVPYFVDIWWYYPPWGFEDNTIYSNIYLLSHGGLVRLPY